VGAAWAQRIADQQRFDASLAKRSEKLGVRAAFPADHREVRRHSAFNDCHVSVASRRAMRAARRWCAVLVRSIASVSSPTSLDFYDAELRAHHEHLRAAYGISPGDEVLDIGCGTGLTTRDAARAAAPGRVVGVDVSEPMLQRARQLTAAERLANVRYERGDAQVHRFAPARFDVAISRFGTMFFADPVAAFANIAAALRADARLVLLVWQRLERNEWVQLIDAALGDAAQPTPPGADPFSLGDAEATARILETAGFDDVRFEEVHEPVFYGPDPDAALAVVRGFRARARPSRA
jgi:SAM-dependent methyltransferase